MERRAWHMLKAGDLDRLSLRTEELPPREPFQATIEVAAIGLNFADLFACLGLYSATPTSAFIPGLEFAGTVIEPDDKGLVRKGQKVMGCIRFGAYATHLQADARALAPVPAGWSFAQGASFPVQSLTAWCALHELGNLQPDHLVLVHSAAGGVGLQAIRMIQHHGARVVGTVSTEEKREFLVAELGLAPEAVIVRQRKRFERQLTEALGDQRRDGFDLILDSLAGPFFRPAYNKLTPFGRQVIFGAASMMPRGKRPSLIRLALQYMSRPKLDPLRMISDNRGVLGFNLIWMWHRIDDLRPMCDNILAMDVGPPYIGDSFQFDDLRQALRHFQSGTTKGKVIVLTRPNA